MAEVSSPVKVTTSLWQGDKPPPKIFNLTRSCMFEWVFEHFKLIFNCIIQVYYSVKKKKKCKQTIEM